MTDDPVTDDQATLTGVDRCPTCDAVVTFERHRDEAGRVVHDTCATALVAGQTEEHFLQARAVTDAVTAHVHELRDVDGRHAAAAGIPGAGMSITMRGPIYCGGCDATHAAIVAALDDSDHDVTEQDGLVIVKVVLPS